MTEMMSEVERYLQVDAVSERDTALTDLERIALDGLMAVDREIVRLYIQPHQANYQTFTQTVEQRLGLGEGAIGTTHGIADGRVVPQPEPEGTP